MAVQLRSFSPLDNSAEFKRFVSLPWSLYKDDPTWVAPLRLQVLDDLDVKKNPFYQHAKICLWNAYKDERQVGRVAAVVDSRHNEFHGERTGFFGFFESVNDPEVARALIGAAQAWVKEHGQDRLRGPASPSFNHSVGTQVDNFSHAPYLKMPYNPSYYPALLEATGLAKVKDLLAYEMKSELEGGGFPPLMVKLAERVNRKNRITYRSINMKDFAGEIRRIREIYNDAWEKNWGFVPMDDAEFDHMAKFLKDIIWPEMCLIAEIDGNPIAFSVTLPDLNQVLRGIPNGKLLPFGIFKLLLGLRPRKGKVDQARVITLGVKQDYRATGVASLLFFETYKRSPAMGIKRGEMSWILEDNVHMKNAAEMMGGKPYKTFRVYEKSFP